MEYLTAAMQLQVIRSNRMSNKPIQPTEEMIEAGIREVIENLDIDYLTDDELSDAVVFIWQAMYQAHVEK